MIVHKKYVPLTLLTAYRAVELRVNMLKDNIKMGIKGIAFMTSGLNLIWSIYILRSQLSSTTYSRKRKVSCQVDPVLETALHIHCVVPPAYVQLCNPHTTPSNILSSSSKEMERLTSHYTTKVLFFLTKIFFWAQLCRCFYYYLPGGWEAIFFL